MLRGRNLCRPAPWAVFFFHYCRFLLHLPIIFYIYLRLFDGINLKLGYERGESELKGEPSRCDDDGNDDDCDDNDLMILAIYIL